jgi:hypothetical protein
MDICSILDMILEYDGQPVIPFITIILQIYPTSCRNTGVGIANCIGQVGSIVAPLVTITLVENCRQEKAVFVMDLLPFFAGAACVLFPHETKGQEIQ